MLGPGSVLTRKEWGREADLYASHCPHTNTARALSPSASTRREQLVSNWILTSC